MGIEITKDFAKMNKIIGQFPGEADAWLRGVCIQMLNEIVLSFNTSPGGRVYELYKPRRTHTASTPNNPPNVDTGALRASMTFTKNGELDYQIHDQVEYGIYLEYGTAKMAPRPFVNPVFKDWQGKVAGDFKNYFAGRW